MTKAIVYDTEYGFQVLVVEGSRVAEATFSEFGDTGEYYFNRLFVPPHLRGKGIATNLLSAAIAELDKRGKRCLCEVNAYGDLDSTQLEKMYSKFGFVKRDDGCMVRECNRSTIDEFADMLVGFVTNFKSDVLKLNYTIVLISFTILIYTILFITGHFPM